MVHGIGKQRPLDTARKVCRGLKNVYKDDLDHLEDTERGTIDLRLHGSPDYVRLYDVHWAPLFDENAKGSFVPETVQSVAIFPWLNRRHGMYEPPRRLGPVLLWTLLLVPVATLAYVGLWGARLFGGLLLVVRNELPQAPTGGSWWKVARRQADASAEAYTPVDDLLDKVAGDVFQYVEGSVPAEGLPTDADRVRARFFECLEAARADGCQEVQVLAHSLGTVVAYNALTGYRLPEVAADPQDRAVEVSRLWTIGSPLEKMAFFFPAMTQAEPISAYRTGPELGGVHGAATRMPWVNFRNPLDPVAGRLRSFPGWQIDNRRVWAGGVGRSHVVYERNARFLEAMTESLFGSAKVQPVSRWARLVGFLAALGESVALVALLVVPVVAGALLLVAAAAFLPWIAGFLVGLVAPDSVADGVKEWGLRIIALPMLAVLLVISPLMQSSEQHRVWRRPTSRRDSAGPGVQPIRE